jgi:hypothetical protein
MQKYFRTRENRNFSTVRSTEQRIFNFSLIEVLMMVAMAGLQVAVVRFFFTGSRKGEFELMCELRAATDIDCLQAMYRGHGSCCLGRALCVAPNYCMAW